MQVEACIDVDFVTVTHIEKRCWVFWGEVLSGDVGGLDSRIRQTPRPYFANSFIAWCLCLDKVHFFRPWFHFCGFGNVTIYTYGTHRGRTGGAGPPNFGTTQKSVVSANAQIKVLESWCLGTSARSAAHLNGLHTCSSRSNAQFKFGALKGAVSALKALQGSETETRGLLGGTKEKSFVFPVNRQIYK